MKQAVIALFAAMERRGRTRLTVARGCDPKVLAKIRKDVFDIAEPK